MEGYIKLYRKFLDWHWYKDGEMVRLWLYLLLRASSKDTVMNGIEIKRGDVVLTRREFCRKFNMSEQVFRTCIKRLTDDGCIQPKVHHKLTQISILHYNDYQAVTEGSNPMLTQNQPNVNPILRKKQENKERTKEIKEVNKEITRRENKEKIFINKYPKESLAPFLLWLDYKKARKEGYKTEASEEQCLKKLMKLGDNDPVKMTAVVNQSMANNWAGLFALKEDDKPHNDTITYEGKSEDYIRITELIKKNFHYVWNNLEYFTQEQLDYLLKNHTLNEIYEAVRNLENDSIRTKRFKLCVTINNFFENGRY